MYANPNITIRILELAIFIMITRPEVIEPVSKMKNVNPWESRV
jgi:hypothetical protein